MILFLDIETNSTHSTIWCVVTQVGQTQEVHYGPSTLAPLIEHAEKVVGHNAIAFDFHVLSTVWGLSVPEGKQEDTLVLSRLQKPDREGGHSLESWGERLECLKGTYDNWDNPDMEQLVAYCKQDVNLLVKVYDTLTYELDRMKFSRQCIDLEYEVARVLAQQQRNGWLLDYNHAIMLLSTLKDRQQAIVFTLQEKWQPKVVKRTSEKTGKPLKDHVIKFNPNSRDHIAERLIECGWKPEMKTPTGKWIVDESTLEGVEIPEAKMVLESLMLQKRISQLQSWLDEMGEDNRVHGYVNSIGAVTGRCTHSSPNMSQVAGVNVPWGKEMRQCWGTPDDKRIVGVDLSGIELRCLAHYMQDPEYQKELLEGDIHTKNQKAAGLETRAQAKTFIYALLYGAGPAKIGSIVGGDAKTGQKLIASFMQQTPALRRLQEKVAKLSDKGHLPGLDGRRVWIRSPHAALNTLLQSAGAIVSKQWMVLANKALKEHGVAFKQLNYSHDELEFEVDEKDVDKVRELVEYSAVLAGTTLGFRCPVAAESKVGKNWYDVH